MTLDEMRAEFVRELTAAKDITGAVSGAEREPTDEERQQVEEHVAAAAKLKADMDAKQKKADRDESLTAQIEALAGSTANDGTPLKAYGSIGDQFVSNPAYKEWLGSFPNGRIPESARGITSPAIEAKGLGSNLGMDPAGHRKVITDIGDLSGAQRLIPPQNIGLVNQPFYPAPNTFDLVSKSTTTSDTIHYARIGTQTNAAVVVPETQSSAADATPTTAEGFKPESDLTFTPDVATVYTIAHWIAATKQALSDFGQLRTLIDNFLVNGLRDKVDGYVLSGTGTNEPKGILTASAAFTTAYATSSVVSIRKGLTALALLGVVPNAVVMNPADTEALDLAQNANGVYYFGGGPSAAPSGYPIWGVRRVDDVKMTSGFALLGDFSMAVWYDREQATVTASDSHADFFIRNLVAILGEMRGAFAVLRPNAFNIVDVAP